MMIFCKKRLSKDTCRGSTRNLTQLLSYPFTWQTWISNPPLHCRSRLSLTFHSSSSSSAPNSHVVADWIIKAPPLLSNSIPLSTFCLTDITQKLCQHYQPLNKERSKLCSQIPCSSWLNHKGTSFSLKLDALLSSFPHWCSFLQPLLLSWNFAIISIIIGQTIEKDRRCSSVPHICTIQMSPSSHSLHHHHFQRTLALHRVQ